MINKIFFLIYRKMRGERGLGHAELDSVLDKVTYDIKEYRTVQYSTMNTLCITK